MGCVLDRGARTISFFKNGTALGEAFALPPALDREAFYPAVCLKGCAVRLKLWYSTLAAFPSRKAASHELPP